MKYGSYIQNKTTLLWYIQETKYNQEKLGYYSNKIFENCSIKLIHVEKCTGITYKKKNSGKIYKFPEFFPFSRFSHTVFF